MENRLDYLGWRRMAQIVAVIREEDISGRLCLYPLEVVVDFDIQLGHASPLRRWQNSKTGYAIIDLLQKRFQASRLILKVLKLSRIHTSGMELQLT